MKKWLLRISLGLGILILSVSILLYIRLHDRHPDYNIDLTVAASKPSRLSAGFAAVKITPVVSDSWIDKNNDYKFNEEDGDTYQDGNGNGKFDAVWMAGFHNNRPAQGVHDDLWARCMIIDDGKTRLALVAIDAIGFGSDDIIDVRKGFPKEWNLTYAIITSTHTHQSPDLIGMWGKSEYSSGVNSEYTSLVKQKIHESVESAIENIRPARIKFAQDLEGAKNLMTDARDPKVLDCGLRIMHVTDVETDSTLGTLISWANHPETLEDKNLLISSDFPHYVRESFEKGIQKGDSTIHKGVGGVSIYVNGAIGGLMTTWSDFGISDLFSDTKFDKPTYQKTEAQGQRLALLGLNALEESTTQVDESSIQLRAKTIHLPLDNKLYRLGAALGIFTRGLSGWWKIRTEISVWSLGPATFLHEPGELYPEIANGGIETPEGQDYRIEPMETPSLRELSPGEFKFIIGLSNDMIGYIIPKSQWDEVAPYTYQQTEAPYGEINSVGPRTGPIIYSELKNILEEFSKK